MGDYGRGTIHGISFEICLMEYYIWNPELDTLTIKWDGSVSGNFVCLGEAGVRYPIQDFRHYIPLRES